MNGENGFKLIGKIAEAVKLSVLPGGRKKFTTRIAVPFRGLEGKLRSTNIPIIILDNSSIEFVKVGDEVEVSGEILSRRKKIEFAGEIEVIDFFCSEFKILKRSE